jgi:hypothetical protein
MPKRPRGHNCTPSLQMPLQRSILVAVICALISPVSGVGAQYFLLNYAPDGLYSGKRIGSSALMSYVSATFGTGNRRSPLKVGVSCLYYPGVAKGGSRAEVALMRQDLALAERLNVPILVQVDVDNWLPASLLNWYNPSAAGYNPAKRADVEWYGWDASTAVKLSWRNWGAPGRVGPPPNYLSANYKAYEKQTYNEFLPVVVRWYHNLPANQKWIFVGWRCGWESSLNNNYRYFEDGNSYYGKTSNPRWSLKYTAVGYNAAQTGGIQTNGVITTDTIAKIVGRHLDFLAQMACSAGIPRNKIFAHGTVYTNVQQNVDALVNSHANPGVSFYGDNRTPLNNNAAFMRAVQIARTDYGANGYCYGEFNLFTANYGTWSSWLTNALLNDTNCIYQFLYNFDSARRKPSVERALLDAQDIAASKDKSPANSGSL